MTKRGLARFRTSLVSLFLVTSSLGVTSPANAATYDGVSGTIDCSISGTVTIANNVVTTHTNCSGSVEIPAAIASVADSAFEYAPAIQAVTFQSSSQLTRIGSYSFSFAESLTSIVIPASVTTIDDYAFESATSLSHVYFLGDAPGVGFDAFSFVASGAKAVIKPGATGFPSPGQTWNGLIVEEERFSVTYNTGGGTTVDSGSFAAGGSIQSAPETTRAGYTLIGWSTSENGSVIEFPYSPPTSSDITLYAIWEINNGEFKCTTGLPLEGDDTSPTYTISNGTLSAGYDCAGAVVIASGVTSIGNWAFNGASQLQSVSFATPIQLTSIGNGGFGWTSSLTSITIPASVTNLGQSPFYASTGLSSVTVDAGNPNFSSIEGVLFDKLGTTLIYYPGQRSDTTYSIPSNVTTIQDYAFAFAKVLTNVTIPSGVSSIPTYAFDNATSLISITIPSSVTSIGESAFYNARALSNITIPSSVTSIGNSAFYNTASLTSITIPSSVTRIGDYAFHGATSLTSVTIPSSVTSIGSHAFQGATSLSSITIPSSVTSIGNFAFSWMPALTSITIPASVTNFGIGVFYYSTSLSNINVDANNESYRSSDGVLFNKLATTLISYPAGKSGTSYSIPASVTTVGNSAFSNASSLTEITIPQTVTKIEAYAFQKATSLTSITIPARVSNIEFYAFEGASSLASAYFLGNAPIEVDSAFTNIAPNAKAYIKYGATGFANDGETWKGLVVERAIEEESFTVTFDSAGGSAVESDSLSSGSVLQTAPTSTRIGHTLVGWSTSEAGSVVEFPYTPSATGDFTLHAIWSLNSYIVSFNSQGGSAVANRTLSYGQSLTVAPRAPTRSGYVFTGWSETTTGSLIRLPYTPSGYASKTLYAKWIQKANVTKTKPEISGKAMSSSSGTNKLTVKPGTWMGIPTPVISYQWYSCTKQIKTITATIPMTCKTISKQTKSTLPVLTAYKGKYLAVKVTGTSAGTSSTSYLTASSSRVN